MIDLPAFYAVASGLNQVYDMTKRLLDLKVSSDVSMRITATIEQIGEVTRKLAEANISLAMAHQEIMELRIQAKSANEFLAEKERYALHELGFGALCYAPKESDSCHEPTHYLCCRRYGENRKSILQLLSADNTYNTFACPLCKSEVRYPHGIKPPARPTRRAPGGMQSF